MCYASETSDNLGDVDHRALRPELSLNREKRRKISMPVFVVSKTGERLMPTTRYGKVRHLLKNGEAKIIGRNPFTIQLCYDSTSYTQPMELCVDTGAQHIGISVKSETQEYVSAQYDLLTNEKERHDDRRRYRRARRNRLRYRRPRFDNRRTPDGWLAPSLKNNADRHVDIIRRFCAVVPITSIVVEVGQFDTQLLAALQEGTPIPEGTDYQQGERYNIATLREAVFQRDHYKCRFCGRDPFKDGAVLHVHHVYFWRGQHGNRLSELASCCEKCHTSENHKPGGKLYGWDKGLPQYTGAAFMNSVKWHIYNEVKHLAPEVHLTYGAATKLTRGDLGMEKSHANDAFAMGSFHPVERAPFVRYTKRRRNNRILERFYDAKYIDTRDGKRKSGAQLGCQRTNRREPRMSEKNLRIYHGPKETKGKRSIRRQHYSLQPGDLVLWRGERYTSHGCHCNGTRAILRETKKSVKLGDIRVIRHAGGWVS